MHGSAMSMSHGTSRRVDARRTGVAWGGMHGPWPIMAVRAPRSPVGVRVQPGPASTADVARPPFGYVCSVVLTSINRNSAFRYARYYTEPLRQSRAGCRPPPHAPYPNPFREDLMRCTVHTRRERRRTGHKKDNCTRVFKVSHLELPRHMFVVSTLEIRR